MEVQSASDVSRKIPQTCSITAMIPFWMWALSGHFLRGFYPVANIKVPYIKIISSLITMIAPLLLGVVLAHYKPNLSRKARQVCCSKSVLIVAI